ncbi:hypothetical protein [Bacteroides eggerthii]|uniref:hypothetical protein n=1 Tax=Bacteroides eggerthii TaxID=28111 RepID=UPI000E47207D|nr:hypothetical protein [Bacteroides eggerthii]RHB91262.1 hypothetical protein DW866_13880 [Bacteroides eggerthii]
MSEKISLDSSDLTLIFFLSLCSDIVKAQNRYDTPAEAPIINTYVPMSHEEMMLRAAAAVWKKRQAIESFAEYSRTAYFYLQKKQIGHFVNYANAALSTGHYNIQLYYNLGISYYLLGQQRKGKRFLKKASKKGFTEANHALFAIKKKEALSYSWFIL